MEQDVADYIVEERLSGSKPLLYCIGGWLLNKLCQSKLRGLTPKMMSKFAAFNMLTVSAAKLAGVPCAEIENHEYKPRALKQLEEAWFHFACLLESLYLVNTTSRQAVHHCGKQIAKVTAKSFMKYD